MTCNFIFFFREFFSSFMVNESNKVIYNAQKFIKTVINVLNIEYHTGKIEIFLFQLNMVPVTDLDTCRDKKVNVIYIFVCDQIQDYTTYN